MLKSSKGETIVQDARERESEGMSAMRLTRRALLQRGGGLTGMALLASACAPSAVPSAPAPTSAPQPTAPPASAAPTAAVAAAARATSALASAPVAGSAPVKFAGVLLPTYIPTTSGARPDLPSSDPNISDAYRAYPKDPPKVNATTPGRGSEVTTMVGAYYPPSTPLEQNPAWQEVNRQLGATVRMNPISLTDLFTKTATLMAGDSLPDLMSFSQGWNAAPNLPQFVEAKCADLTQYLSGDAIKSYPNLAAIPTAAWKHTAYKGRIFSVPIHRPAVYNVLYLNSTMYNAEIGQGVVPKNADDFKRMMVQLNRPREGRYAYTARVAPNALPWDLTNLARIFGAPNFWKVDDRGALVRDFETEEFKAAVGFARDMYAAGLFHPDTVSFNSPIQMETAFLGNKAVFAPHNMAFYNSLWRRGLQSNPQNIPRVLPPFSADGTSKPIFFLGTRMITTTALKKASPERIKELLAIMDWLAAPFGSQEDRLLSFGVPDVDYTVDANGNPVPTDRGPADASYVPWRYLSQRPYVIYDPDLPDYAHTLQSDEKVFAPLGVEDATFGIYSSTFAAKGTQINLSMNDGLSDIVQGHRPLSDYDTLVKEWLANGGEQIRSEYQQAMSASA